MSRDAIHAEEIEKQTRALLRGIDLAVVGYPEILPPIAKSPYMAISQENTAVAIVAFGGKSPITPTFVINREHDMLDRPALPKTGAIKEAAPTVPTGHDKPSLQQFQLKVDGQIKDSFTIFEVAQKAELKIKTAHPVVQVSVYDSVEGAKTIITAEKA